MFTNALAIITHIKADLAAIPTLPDGININLDEPITLVYEDLPSLSVYPLREEYLAEDSFQSESKKRLLVRVELRLKGSPASTLCTPVINLICDAIRADRTLGGNVDYVEIQSIQWANDIAKEGYVCGASIDLQIDYLC